MSEKIAELILFLAFITSFFMKKEIPGFYDCTSLYVVLFLWAMTIDLRYRISKNKKDDDENHENDAKNEN